jgi:hypothetical protein
MSAQGFKIEKPYYPIVYVRGYAMRVAEREETFNDTYYGFSATSVEKRQAPAPQYFEADVFEGQLIRFMKIRDYGYADSVNRGLEVFLRIPPGACGSRDFTIRMSFVTRSGRSKTTPRICTRLCVRQSPSDSGRPAWILERMIVTIE